MNGPPHRSLAPSTRQRSTGTWMSCVVGLALITLPLVTNGCRNEQPPAPDEAAEAPAAAGAPALVDGWTCETVSGCFALSVGRTQSWQRQVGDRSETETRTLADAVPRDDLGDGGRVFVDSDGTARYGLHGADAALALELRGQLLEAVRFPVVQDDHFTVDDGAGNRVTMTVLDTAARVETPAGAFGPCLVHEARFENPEQPSSRGLRIETTLCEGVGEVARRIELPALPLPVELTLLSRGDAAPGDRG